MHDLGLGTGKIMTTYVDDNGYIDPVLIDFINLQEPILTQDMILEVDENGCTPSQLDSIKMALRWIGHSLMMLMKQWIQMVTG